MYKSKMIKPIDRLLTLVKTCIQMLEFSEKISIRRTFKISIENLYIESF